MRTNSRLEQEGRAPRKRRRVVNCILQLEEDTTVGTRVALASISSRGGNNGFPYQSANPEAPPIVEICRSVLRTLPSGRRGSQTAQPRFQRHCSLSRLHGRTDSQVDGAGIVSANRQK